MHEALGSIPSDIKKKKNFTLKLFFIFVLQFVILLVNSCSREDFFPWESPTAVTEVAQVTLTLMQSEPP
jgi:hypothetical protein